MRVRVAILSLIATATLLVAQQFPFPGGHSSNAGGGSLTFTNVQRGAINTGCSTASTTCAATVTSTGAGHIIVVGVFFVSALAPTIQSVSGGGTYTRCAVCSGIESTAFNGVEVAYTLSSTSGTTSITVTMTAAPDTFWGVVAWEYSFTGGTPVFDTGGNVPTTTGTTSVPGVGLTLTGTSDLILQMGQPNGCFTAITSPYDTNADLSTCLVIADRLNTNVGTAPTITQNAADPADVGAIAFK